MKKTSKLMLSVVLSFTMILMLIPAASFAADNEYKLWIGGTQVSDSIKSGEGWTYEGDATGGTITLKNASITGSHESLLNTTANIYSDNMNISIILEGDNTVGSEAALSDIGIWCKGGSLSVSGSGTLNVSGKINAVFAKKNLDFNETNVTAYSKDLTAVYSDNGVLTVNGGKMTVTGDFDALHGQDVVINGAEVDAVIKKGGIETRIDGDCIIKDSTVNITSSERTIDANHSISIENSKLTASASDSDSLCAHTGNITIKNSTVDLTAKGSNKAIYDLSTSGLITISDSAVKAQSGSPALYAAAIEVTGGEDTYVEATCDTPQTPAVFSTTEGAIQIGTGLAINEPEGAASGNYKNGAVNGSAVLDKSGAPAAHVIIAKENTSGTDDPTPGTDDPTPGKDDPTPGKDDPTPGKDDPTPGTDDPTPQPSPEQIIKLSNSRLLTKVTAKGKKNLVISWNKITGAEGYDVFFAKCTGKDKNAPKLAKTITDVSTVAWTKSGLKAKTAYKAYVKAWIMKDNQKVYVKTSPVAHAFTSGGNSKYTNPKSITVKKNKVSLKKGKTYKIAATVNKLQKNKKLIPKTHAANIRYMSNDTKIATVNKAGKITAKGKGTCKIYVYAINGVSKVIKITVK